MTTILGRLTEAERAIIAKHTATIPVKLGALAQELGLTVLSSTLPPGISGEIKRDSDGNTNKYTIRINRHERKERQRFTLAHEIGHYLLHREKIGDGLSDDVLYRSKLSNALEYEANRIAAELTMPRAKLEECMRDVDNFSEADIESLADQFGVSKEAMAIRIGV